uniref:Uncharacterized protein n=1 Tax=Arundo donax TaxID=35708 RepID=A0A0A9GV84_ARUDO
MPKGIHNFCCVEHSYSDKLRISHKTTHILHKQKSKVYPKPPPPSPPVWSHAQAPFFHGWMTATTMITTITSSMMMA